MRGSAINHLRLFTIEEHFPLDIGVPKFILTEFLVLEFMLVDEFDILYVKFIHKLWNKPDKTSTSQGHIRLQPN